MIAAAVQGTPDATWPDVAVLAIFAAFWITVIWLIWRD